MKQKVLVIDNHDKEIWERITNVPYVSKGLSVLVLFLNLLLPGLGTAIAACNTKYDSVSKAQLVVAGFQFLTCFLIVGFIFAFYWSFLIIKKAFSEDGELAERQKKEAGSKSARAGGGGQGYGATSDDGATADDNVGNRKSSKRSGSYGRDR